MGDKLDKLEDELKQGKRALFWIKLALFLGILSGPAMLGSLVLPVLDRHSLLVVPLFLTGVALFTLATYAAWVSHTERPESWKN